MAHKASFHPLGKTLHHCLRPSGSLMKHVSINHGLHGR